jgi:hypothetical protein
MRAHLTAPVLASIVIVVTAMQCARADTSADVAVDRYVAAIGAQQDSRVTGRRLLALRSYLRSGKNLEERWSWTQEQIAAYEGSPEQRELQREIGRVRTAFVAGSPGLELYVNPEVRSLDSQIEHWNTNDSVAAAADGILAAAQALVESSGFPAAQPEKAADVLCRFLSGYTPVPTPTIAAPGLSPHGQMRAIDFQVHQGNRVVAGPSTATIATDWEAGGWAAKLDAAVRATSSRFVGPLANPREPWHYTYTPESVAAQ